MTFETALPAKQVNKEIFLLWVGKKWVRTWERARSAPPDVASQLQFQSKTLSFNPPVFDSETFSELSNYDVQHTNRYKLHVRLIL